MFNCVQDPASSEGSAELESCQAFRKGEGRKRPRVDAEILTGPVRSAGLYRDLHGDLRGRQECMAYLKD